MSTKKNKSKNINQLTKSPKRQNVRNQGPTSKADAEKIVLAVKELMNKKIRSPLLKQVMAQADISAILKEPGDALHEDCGENSFNPPLHSTAVYTDDDMLPYTSENPDQISPIPPVVKEKRPTRRESKRKPAANTEDSAHRPDTARPNRTPQKKAVHVPEPGSAKKHRAPRNQADGAGPSQKPQNTTPNKNVTPQKKAVHVPEPGSVKKHRAPRNLTDGAGPSQKPQNTTPNKNVVSAKKTQTQRKEENTSSKKKLRKDKTETAPTDTWSPENMPKSVRSVNELDLVLFECGKHIEMYRENVETDICKRAIDVFFHSFEEQLSTTISHLRKLKDLKRKNAKMQLEIGRKRKRLIEVKDEIIAKRPKLNQLQKESSELEQKLKSVKSARAFLDNLAQLQEDYMKFKAENLNIKDTYGTSSLPALCVEAENIMKAEQHFHIVNKKLQSFIDEEKGDV